MVAIGCKADVRRSSKHTHERHRPTCAKGFYRLFPALRLSTDGYPRNENRRLHLVSIPYDKRLRDLYVPLDFSSDEYPNLIAAGETVETVAASVLLVALNLPEKTERYQKVAKFVDALFSRIDEFSKPPRQPKWKEASITAIVPGWQRFKAAQDWLDRWHEQNEAARKRSPAKFKDFLAHEGALRSVPGRDTEIIRAVPRVGTTRQELASDVAVGAVAAGLLLAQR